jgi:translation initiation factor IF-2
MGKMKVHELAKELNMQSKDLIDKLKDMNYDVKNHLSTLEEDDVKKITKALKGEDKNKKVSAPKRVGSDVHIALEKETEKPLKKEKKPIAPVIIRREVTRIVETNEEKPKNENVSREGIGVIERRTDTKMNIKYRTPARPIGPITQSKPEAPKVEQIETKPQEIQKPEIKKEEHVAQKIENKNVVQNRNITPEQHPVNRVENKENGNNREQNNDYRNQRPNFNPNYHNNQNNQSGQNNQNRPNYQNRPSQFNQNRPGQNNQNRPNNRPPFKNDFKNANKEKDIKDMLTNVEAPVKEPARETVRTGYKDKQKDNRKFEDDSKKNTKNKTFGQKEEINLEKLKDLQAEDKLSHMFNDTDGAMFDYYDLSKRKDYKKGKRKPTESKEHIEQKIFELTDIEIPDSITVKELAEKIKKQSSEIIKKLLGYGILATLNNDLDFDTAYLVANEFGITAHKKNVVTEEEILFDESDDNEEDTVARPPIVVVMGHVDHGKTSLLDAIRSTNMIEKEAGGITQHIGAYKVKINDREITFLDTPGHEAFTAMRARGAQVTDIAIIVVAADDGIMPQTIEAINHAKAANVSIIVAINKIDKPGADIERIKQNLTEYGLVPEEWGGDTICVPISAKLNKNIDALLEMVLLVADMKNLRSNPNKQSKGTVLEARLDKNKGITASLLVQRGTLNIGDTIVVGSVIGRIRGMVDEKGQTVKLAGPSTPVEVIGLSEVPDAGEIFYEVENEKVAKHLIEKRKSKQREDMIRKSSPVTLDNLFNQIEQGKLKDLNIIIKADVQGSVQAIRQSLEKIQNEEARVRIIHANVGAITESDITLAKVTNAIVIGFNVRPDTMAASIADREGVEIKLYSVIYSAIDDITAALKGMLKPKYKEVIQGTAEVRQVFKITNVGAIAGCYVIDGKIVRNSGVRVLRDNVVVHEGKLISLKRQKDDAKEVATGYECGVQVEDYNDIKEGDKIESFIMEEIKQ